MMDQGSALANWCAYRVRGGGGGDGETSWARQEGHREGGGMIRRNRI